ncbi:MAG: stress response translation initiation inhibitor YciH [Candidatus Aenigmatarchaeota archaeon]
MQEICKVCGYPIEFCVCRTIEREAQKIKISVEARKFGKNITVVEGITENAKEIVSQLKQMLACGGTYKNNKIELQGDHRNKIKEILMKLGYGENQIEVI